MKGRFRTAIDSVVIPATGRQWDHGPTAAFEWDRQPTGRRHCSLDNHMQFRKRADETNRTTGEEPWPPGGILEHIAPNASPNPSRYRSLPEGWLRRWSYSQADRSMQKLAWDKDRERKQTVWYLELSKGLFLRMKSLGLLALNAASNLLFFMFVNNMIYSPVKRSFSVRCVQGIKNILGLHKVMNGSNREGG